MRILKPAAFSLLVALVAAIGTCAGAQKADSTQIYLDEPAKEPPPTVVQRSTLTEDYENENRRLERDVVRLSNDQIVNHGKYVEFYQDGNKYSTGTYEMGLYEGPWQYWYPNGQSCKSVIFKAGKPHGKWDIFRPDGTLKASKAYQDGLRHGPWKYYFEDGKQLKVELTYNQGKIEGERFNYYPNGQLRQQIHFENGLMHGKATNWNEAGQKISEMQFENGKLVGKPQRFDVTPKANDKKG